jgi:hypothetical protein
VTVQWPPGQVAEHCELPLQMSVTAPSTFKSQTLPAEQVTWLPSPTPRAHMLAPLQSTLLALPALSEHALPPEHIATQPSPQEPLQVSPPGQSQGDPGEQTIVDDDDE